MCVCDRAHKIVIAQLIWDLFWLTRQWKLKHYPHENIMMMIFLLQYKADGFETFILSNDGKYHWQQNVHISMSMLLRSIYFSEGV